MAEKRKDDWSNIIPVDDREHLSAVADCLEAEGQVRDLATVYAAQAGLAPVATFTDRERDLAILLSAEGASVQTIAETLNTPEATIYRSLQNIRKELNADNDTELGVIAIAEGIASKKVLANT